MKNPKVSVILSVYNGADYLREAILSILNQSFADFEFVIINDGSTDESESIITSFSDPRITLITHSSKRGLPASLNEGIAITKSKYIARMDADDISLPQRLEREVKFLEENPGIGVVGTQMQLIDKQNRVIGETNKFLEHPLIKWAHLFSSPLNHPTIMARKEIMLANPYSEKFLHCEDYELWSRLMDKTTLANLPERLVRYRVHNSSVSYTPLVGQKENSVNVSLANIKKYLRLSASEEKGMKEFRLGRHVTISAMTKVDLYYQKIGKNFIKQEKVTKKQALQIHNHLQSLRWERWKFYLRILFDNSKKLTGWY